MPRAPGTAGSAVALPIAWLLFSVWGWPGVATGAVLFTVVGIWAAERAERYYGKHDCQKIVVDEIAGQLLTMVAVPSTIPNLLVGFGWFRLCDSLKPFPAGLIDRRVKGGFGVVLDDVAAGVQAAVLTAILHHLGLTPWLWSGICSL
jgi:phosphatidylglycerophosphatase A